jgi:glycoside/pentoside/hexuronide:cation symporter, GPH family
VKPGAAGLAEHSDLQASGEAIEDVQSGPGQKVPLTAAIGWGFGSLGVLILLNATNALLLKYFVDIMGISVALAGTILAATRIFDAVLDPFMGAISDSTRTRWGRRRPYLLVGGIMCAVSTILLFAAPTGLSDNAAVVYIVGALLFYAVAYTVFSVPYMAMPVEMTQDPNERTRLFSFRIYGSSLAGLIGAGTAPMLVDYFGGGRDGFAAMAFVLSVPVLVFCLASFFMTANAPVATETVTDKRPKWTQLRYALDNKPFVSLMIMKIFIVGGLGVGASSLVFFVNIVLEHSLTWMSYIAYCLTAGIVISQFLWVKFSIKYGKRRCFFVSSCLYMIALLSWLAAGPQEGIALLMLRAVAIGFFAGGISLTTQAMLPDTLAYDYKLSGVRREGVLTGIYTTVERGASALGVAIAAWVLGAGGYIEKAAASAQPESVIISLYVGVVGIPVIALFASMYAASKYDLPG